MKQLLALLAVLFLGTSIYAQTILRYHLKKDDVFTIRQEARQTITQELQGTTHELVNMIDGVLQFKVLGQVGDNYEIELMFKDLNLQMTSNLQGELMNVRAKEASEGDMQSQMFNCLLDSPVKMLLASTGDILEVQGGDSLVSKMVKASGLEDEFSLEMIKTSLEKEFGSEALSNSYKQMTFIYPARPIKIGDTWENEYGGRLNAKNTWTLTSIDEAQSNIHGDAEVIMEVIEPATTMKLTGTQSSEIIASTVNGFISKMTVEGSSTGITTMAQLGSQEIPTTLKSIITYQLIKV